MTIVSQDKKMICNYDNIEAIGVGNPLENNDGKFRILIATVSDNEYTIAEYNTEERATEVLNEIVTRLKKYLLITDDRNRPANYLQAPKVFEMPQE